MPTEKIKGLYYDYTPNIKSPIMPIEKDFDNICNEWDSQFLNLFEQKIAEAKYKIELGNVELKNWQETKEVYMNAKQSKTKQRDWEIVAIRSKGSELTFEKQKNGLFRSRIYTNSFEEWTEEYLLTNPKGYEIFSVKRLSDNEVFSIGDNWCWYQGGDMIKTIGFEVSPRNGNMILKYQGGGIGIQHLPSKRKAVEYRIMNTPCLSVNDIFNAFTPLGSMLKYHSDIKTAILDLAKSKL